MKNAVWSRPAQSLMLRAYDTLYEEPVYHEQDDRSNVDKYVCYYAETDVPWVARPCYSQGHGDDSNLAETYNVLIEDAPPNFRCIW